MHNALLRELADLYAATIDSDLVPVPHYFTLPVPGIAVDERASWRGFEPGVTGNSSPHLYVGYLSCHIGTAGNGANLPQAFAAHTYETCDYDNNESYSRSQFHTEPRLAVFHNIFAYSLDAFANDGPPPSLPGIRDAVIRFIGYRIASPSTYV